MRHLHVFHSTAKARHMRPKCRTGSNMEGTKWSRQRRLTRLRSKPYLWRSSRWIECSNLRNTDRLHFATWSASWRNTDHNLRSNKPWLKWPLVDNCAEALHYVPFRDPCTSLGSGSGRTQWSRATSWYQASIQRIDRCQAVVSSSTGSRSSRILPWMG